MIYIKDTEKLKTLFKSFDERMAKALDPSKSYSTEPDIKSGKKGYWRTVSGGKKVFISESGEKREPGKEDRDKEKPSPHFNIFFAGYETKGKKPEFWVKPADKEKMEELGSILGTLPSARYASKLEAYRINLNDAKSLTQQYSVHVAPLAAKLLRIK